MFVKWSCGCIGLKLNDLDVTVLPCDRESDDVTFSRNRQIGEKAFVPLTKEETINLVDRIAEATVNGSRLRQIQLLLRL